jgi:hypothetical protein
MPSTFTTNLGIQKPGTGEQSGTWGDTVNTNSDIIDIAINGVLSLSLSGTSSTLTTSDGVVSNGQYKVLSLTGTPSGTHTITISPNDAQKVYFVLNGTAQSVILTQGSGGNVTIAAGDSGIIYSNGGGAGAAVVNLTNEFAMSSVRITGGSIAGITDLAVADGGTGASDAATARTNLGLVIGTNVQAYDAELQAISALAVTDGNFIVGNGSTWIVESGATARTSLGLGTIATQNSASVSITGGSIAGITDLAVADGGTGASDAGTARTNLGLGTIATQSAASVTITGGSITGITDLAVADGGTGASDAATARTNLGAQATITGAATTITGSDLTASRALASDGSGKVAVSAVTSTELGLLSGLTGITPRTSATGATVLSVGTTAQRDVSPLAGYFRYNTSLGSFEGYNGTAWTGVGGATGAGGDRIFWENGQTVTTSYTITNGQNAMSAGPITINSGVTVTVGAGEVWTVV